MDTCSNVKYSKSFTPHPLRGPSHIRTVVIILVIINDLPLRPISPLRTPPRLSTLPLLHPSQQPLVIARYLPDRLFHLVNPLASIQLDEYILVLLVNSLLDE